MASLRYPSPNPQNLEEITLTDKEDLADLIKLKMLRWGDYPGSCEWKK